MDGTDISTWFGDNVPQTILVIGGLLAVLIAVSYVRDKDSWTYKGLTALGFVFGVFMALEAATYYGEWRLVTSLIVAVAAFTLIIRPFREVHFAVIIAVFVMILAYIWLGGLTTVSGIDISFLAENPVRIIAAFVLGAIVYGLLNFGEAIVKGVGKVLNWWPLLLILGLVCVAEGALMFMGYGSIFDYISTGS